MDKPNGSNGDSGDEAEVDDPTGRHALHAHRLEFEHPILGGRIAFESPLPADLCEMLGSLQLDNLPSALRVPVLKAD